MNDFNKKKVLITGNTGFKGSWLSIWCLMKGAIVYGMSKDIPTKQSMFETLKLESRLTQYWLDVRDSVRVTDAVKEICPDVIFHLAAQPIVSKSYKDPIETVETNVLGAANILEAARHLSRNVVIVFITSDKCYENVEWNYGYRESDKLGGSDLYSASKACAEILVNAYYKSFYKNNSNIRICSARAGNVLGGGDWALDRIVPDAIRSWTKNEVLQIRNPHSTRPWQHVLEPLSGYLKLAVELMKSDRLNGMSFNFGPTSEMTKSVEELLMEMSSKWEGEISYEVLGETRTFHEAGLLKLNCDMALAHLNWTSRLDFNELVSFTVDWYMEDLRGVADMFEYTKKQIVEFEIKKNGC